MLQKIINLFRQTKIDYPELEAELILAQVLKKSREFVLAHPELQLSKFQENDLSKMVKRRIDGEPLAYLLGYKEFYGLNFKVNKNILVPRPETELMVDEVLKQVGTKKHQAQNCIFIDVGTGSGAIIISLFKNLPLDFQANSHFFGLDISRSALNIAIKNAEYNQLKFKIKFLQSNLITKILNSKLQTNEKSCIFILANLPYLTQKQIKNSPSIQKEPLLALNGGKNGLEYYHKLLKQLKLLNQKYFQTKIKFFLEISPEQDEKIKQLIMKNEFKQKVEIKKDLAKKKRLVIYS